MRFFALSTVGEGAGRGSPSHVVHRIHIRPQHFPRPVLDTPVRCRLQEPAVLLFIRLRAVLSEVCSDHPVAVCAECGRAHHVEELGTDIGMAFYLCHGCGADLREALRTHAHTCPNLTPQKPLARVAPGVPGRADSSYWQARRLALAERRGRA
jgi:hypothetical protein